MENVQIIGMPQSSFVRTVRIAAEERGVPYEVISAAPHTPEVLAIHPLGKIPVMRHGMVTLCESKAICAYFDTAFPGARLTPEDVLIAAEVEQWVSLINVSLQPAFSAYLGPYYFPNTPDGSRDSARIDPAIPKMREYLGVIERALEDRDWLAGDVFTLADAYAGPILYYLNILPESGAIIGRSPVLRAYVARCEARPSFKATTPPPMPGRQAA